MAKAYRKELKANQSYIWCEYCGTYSPEDYWTMFSGYIHSEYDRISVENSDHSFYDTECSTAEIYNHDYCDMRYYEPEILSQEAWICGLCSSVYEGKDHAVYCCG